MKRAQKCEDLKVATYKYWDIYLSRNQDPCIGACYAWLKEPGECQYAEYLGEEGRTEFFGDILHDCALAISGRWDFQHLQTAFPEDPRYRGHAYWIMVPRRRRKVKFADHVFDERLVFPKGLMYCPRGERVPKALLIKIRDALVKEFPEERRAIRD